MPDHAAAAQAPISAPDVDLLRARVRASMPRVRAELEALVRIPSVSAPAFDPAQVEASAAAVAALLRAAGMPEVEILRVDGGAPAVLARRPAPAGAPDGTPSVLLYAHHDVQPPGDADRWDTPAFEPVERGGRLYGRGCADDKAGIMVHVAALRALADDLGVAVSVFVEGEEEIGSPTFDAFLAAYRDRLAADVIVIADSGNWRIGEPALTTSLRGLVEAVVRVSTLDHAVHSGMYGGPVPDAATALIRLLDTLWDESGAVAVAGLDGARSDDPPHPEYPQDVFRADAGVLDGVRLIGSGRLTSRLWDRPALTVIGTDLPDIPGGSNTLQPSATAKLSLRVPPGQDPAAAYAALAAHLAGHAPWGSRVQVQPGELGSAWAGDVAGPVYAVAHWALEQAWGRPAVHMGVGGSIPFIAALQAVYPGSTVLVTGVEDPDTRAHGANESLHLEEFERACLAQTLLLAALAGRHEG